MQEQGSFRWAANWHADVHLKLCCYSVICITTTRRAFHFLSLRTCQVRGCISLVQVEHPNHWSACWSTINHLKHFPSVCATWFHRRISVPCVNRRLLFG